MSRVVDLKTLPMQHWQKVVLDHYPFPPYSWLRGLAPASCRALMGRELSDTAAADKTCLLGCLSDEQDLLGFAQLRWLEWDTNHFGFQIWRLDHLGAWGEGAQREAALVALVRECLRAVHGRGGQNIQARIPAGNLPAIHALEGAGFQTMEILTTWVFDLERWTIPPKQHPAWVRDSQPADQDALIDLARTVYTPIPDRFHVDPHLSPKASDELYAEWIRNSFSGALADHIAVAEVDGHAVGYATLKDLDDCGGLCNVRLAQLGLGGMSPAYRNQGIVTDLVIHNLEWLSHRRTRFCFVGTQGNNVPPQRVWLKIGFKPAAMALTLHHWANERT